MIIAFEFTGQQQVGILHLPPPIAASLTSTGQSNYPAQVNVFDLYWSRVMNRVILYGVYERIWYFVVRLVEL
jgi:hypothetical protein